MAMNWPTFFTRTGSAIVFGIIMLTGLLWNEVAFLGLLLIIQFLCIREYFQLFRKIQQDKPVNSLTVWIMQIVSLGFTILCFYCFFKDGHAAFYLPVILCFPVILLLGKTLGKKANLQEALICFGALFYLLLPMEMLLYMRSLSIIIPIALILMIWTNDTMAYIVGSFIGKTPFSSISPKKTWEGTAGGAILTIAGAGVWGYYSDYYNLQSWMVLAFCAATAGTAGDLLESKLKRLAGVKDSGNIMPGHGGALDRFDSLLVAIPFAFIYAYLWMPHLPVTIF